MTPGGGLLKEDVAEHRGPMGSLHDLELTPKIKCKVLQKRNAFNLVHLDTLQSYLTMNLFFFSPEDLTISGYIDRNTFWET